jgi:aminoglycoside 6'-N-acetyltransferase
MRIDLALLDTKHVGRLRELHQQPGVTRWWGPMEDGFPFDEPESIRSAILVDGEVAGMVQWGEEDWAHYRHAWIDIFVGDDYTRRGVGTEVVRRTVCMLIEERGHHRITIDPAADNEAAIRCYEKAGFTVVGTLRRASRETSSGSWRDELLMELVSPGP